MGLDVDDIAEGLRSLGLDRTATIVVHASLRSFGRVEGGALSVATALADVCGTVVVPSGTWDLTGVPFPPGLERPNNAALAASTWDEFDAAVAAAVPYSAALPIDKWLGTVPEAFRTGFVHERGVHPLFSFLAVGEHAREVIAAERADWPLGPLEAVEGFDGFVLLLGVSHTSNTTIHLAEQRLGRSRFYRCAKVGPGLWAEFPNVSGHSHRFDDIEPVLAPHTVETTIGLCRARLLPTGSILAAVDEAVRSDPGALLCGDPECRCGAALRQRLIAASRDQAGDAL